MEKWILICIHEREMLPIQLFNSFDEAQAKMRTEFMEDIDPDEFREACESNGEPFCDDWALNEGNAWIGGCTDWYIEQIS